MRVVDNRGLLLKVRNPNKITTAIPNSKHLGRNNVLVKWGVDESRVLQNLNVRNVPSPIMGKYHWPGKYRPFAHQKTTSAFLTMNRRAFCFNEQGTGKTASAIWASDFLMNQKVIKRVLIICPLSIMDSAWRADLFKFAMHRTVSIAHGPKAKRETIINDGAEYVIINYDGVEIVKDVIANGEFDLIIADEATHYKNAQSKRWKVLNSLIKPDTWLWMMTGTPAAQSPLDGYGLAKWVPKPNATAVVFNALQPAIRFTKEQCLDLPEMTYTHREVALTAQQKKYYKILKSHMVAVADGEQITAANAAVNMNKLLQISCGAVYTDSGETIEFDIKNRYKVLREVIDESSQKVLIFVPFKHVIDLLQEKLTKDKITNAVIRGDVSAQNRTRIFDEFQTTDNPEVLIIQPQAAAHGVTLTAANTIVWWGPTSSLETYAQANARVHRSGQTHPCTVVQLQGAPVEQAVYKMLDKRISVHTKMIDLYKEVLEN